MTYLSYKDYICSLQAASTVPDQDCFFIGELVLAQHLDKFCEGASNYVITVDRKRRCLIVCRVEKRGDCACINHITELDQPFGIYKIFSSDFVRATEGWFSLVYVWKEGGVHYDPYYNSLPLADDSEHTIEEMNADILGGIASLGLERQACIVLCDDSIALSPLAYGLQSAFDASVCCVGEEAGSRLPQSQILCADKPCMYFRNSEGLQPLVLDFGCPYQMTLTPASLSLPCELFGNQALADLIDPSGISYDFTLGGLPMKYVQLVAISDACNNITVELSVGQETGRKVIPGSLKFEELHGRWSPVSTKSEMKSYSESYNKTET